ncbi:MAG: hypothetical protein KDE31_19990, partial [Caldilineaceae bacterium]|nr:hypothetical protein [Caldilineaceae bacterium]
MQSWFRSHQQRAGDHPSRTFFLCFIILNTLLFLPLYLLNRDETTLLPFALLSNQDWPSVFHQLVIGRENFDPFRLNIELLLLIVLLVNFAWLRRPGLRPLFVGAYFFLLSYYIYEAITLSIYQSEPVFYNHYFLALDGLRYLFDHLNIAV